nr:hypothetical protein BaRGS_019023 [Batillaria attramentaria]
MEIIPRSSTYDKFPTHSAPMMESSDEQMYCGDGLVSSGNAMYELCDPSSEDLEGSESQNSDVVNLDEAYIQDESMLSSDTRDDTMMTYSVDSLEDGGKNEDSLSVPTSTIDSSTWRKKARPSKDGDVSLQLPNADETCRSMCSFIGANESQNESFARPLDSSVWQRHADDSALSEASFASNASIAGKKGKSKKSVAKSIKSFLSGPKFFGSKQSKDQAKLKEMKDKVDKSFSKKGADAQKTTTSSTGTSTLAKTIVIPTSKPSPAAVVAPFNYSPPSASQVSVTTSSASSTVVTSTQIIAKDTTSNSDASQKGPSVMKHMTKTEMLLARRRQSYLNNYKNEEEGVGEEESSKRGCMVTTV